jgi:hypothetical protein
MPDKRGNINVPHIAALFPIMGLLLRHIQVENSGAKVAFQPPVFSGGRISLLRQMVREHFG